MTATAAGARLDIEYANRGGLIGDLGGLQARIDIQSEKSTQNPDIARLANDLRVMRSRFAESVGPKYLTQRDSDALQVSVSPL